MTLAMARLLVGYERSVETHAGAERAVMALVTSLFHDGITSASSATDSIATALVHPVPRDAQCATWPASCPASAWKLRRCRRASCISLAMKSNSTRSTTDRATQVGQLPGTADLIAQMADRCYLEKCRDRLYPEFRARRSRRRDRYRRRPAGPL
jgi:hypothetical protein